VLTIFGLVSGENPTPLWLGVACITISFMVATFLAIRTKEKEIGAVWDKMVTQRNEF
jgi:site-specific recombinase